VVGRPVATRHDLTGRAGRGPRGVGRTTILDQLAETAGADDAPVTLIACINGRKLPDETGVRAAVLGDCLAEIAATHNVAELLGLDRLGGAAQMARRRQPRRRELARTVSTLCLPWRLARRRSSREADAFFAHSNTG
jgi:hypothetical protein